MNNSKPGRTRNAGTRTPQGLDQVWETRKTLAKHEMAAESAANDAKTARLKALRLEKEAQDAIEAAANPPPPAPPKKRPVKRILAG
jgi:hypothetical protein